jgi:predicted RNase H-like HicB family nuclease
VTEHYILRVVVEPDVGCWYAYCPALEEKGASTWGRNIHEVVQMIVEELTKDGEPLPEEPPEEVQVVPDLGVAVNL